MFKHKQKLTSDSNRQNDISLPESTISSSLFIENDQILPSFVEVEKIPKLWKTDSEINEVTLNPIRSNFREKKQFPFFRTSPSPPSPGNFSTRFLHPPPPPPLPPTLPHPPRTRKLFSHLSVPLTRVLPKRTKTKRPFIVPDQYMCRVYCRPVRKYNGRYVTGFPKVMATKPYKYLIKVVSPFKNVCIVPSNSKIKLNFKKKKELLMKNKIYETIYEIQFEFTVKYQIEKSTKIIVLNYIGAKLFQTKEFKVYARKRGREYDFWEDHEKGNGPDKSRKRKRDDDKTCDGKLDFSKYPSCVKKRKFV